MSDRHLERERKFDVADDVADAVAGPDRGEPPRSAWASGVGGLVADYLTAQFDALTRGDLRLRAGDDAVHKVRVAVRRVRSTLRVFGRLFDSRAGHLDAELAWYAEVLGRVRDPAVIREIIVADLASDPDVLIRLEAAVRLEGILAEEHQHAWNELRTILDGVRYRDLLVEIDRWRRTPPFTALAEQDAAKIKRFLRRAEKKSDRRLAQARAAPEHDSDAAHHRARKAAKRTRYAAELARPQLGRRAKRVAKAHEKRQAALGALQDHVMTIAALCRIGAAPDSPADVTFLCGALMQRHTELKRAARAE